MLLPAFSLPDWPWGGATAELRLYSNVAWLDKDGIHRIAGVPGSVDFYQRFTATVTGRALLFGDGIDTPATDLSLDQARSARITGVLFDGDGIERKTLFKNFRTTDTLVSSSYANFIIFNRGHQKQLGDHYLNDTAVYAAIQRAIVSAPNAIIALGMGSLLGGGEPVTIEEPLTTLTSAIEGISIDNGVIGRLYALNRIAGAGFDMNSENLGDEGDFIWFIKRFV